MKRVLIIGCFISIFLDARAQEDSLLITRDTIVISEPDTVLIQSYAKRFNPRKALLLAAVVPGAGQVYNKKYWKLPLVYGGFYLLGNQVNKFNNIYREYRAHLYYNLENDLSGNSQINPATKRTTGQLRRIVNRARRERDFFVILTGGMYLLQLVDAHVDAHLKEFDLNPDLQVRFEPMIEQDALLGRQTGFALVFRF